VSIITTGDSPLFKPGTVTLNAAGDGQVEIGPVPVSQIWQIELYAVFCTGANNPMPTCTIYRNGVTPQNRVEGTYVGAEDSSPVSLTLRGGETLIAVWRGGVAGSQATFTVQGNQLST
jgi:hypothetical protein